MSDRIMIFCEPRQLELLLKVTPSQKIVTSEHVVIQA